MENRSKRKHLAKPIPAALLCPAQPGKEQQPLPTMAVRMGHRSLFLFVQPLPAARPSLDEKRAEGDLSFVWMILVDGPLRDAPCLYVPCTACGSEANHVAWERCPKAVSWTDRETASYHCSTSALRAVQRQCTWWWQLPWFQARHQGLDAFLKEYLELWVAAYLCLLQLYFEQFFMVSDGCEEKLEMRFWIA